MMKLKDISKRWITLMSLFVIVLITVCLALFAGSREKTAVMMEDSGLTLVIDPGHGGIDSGALGADGTRESDINLAIANRFRALAELYGQDNILLRHDDTSLSDSENYSEHRDLVCRTEMTCSVPNPVYISIHQNCFPTGQPRGAQVLYADNDCSKCLAEITHGNLVGSLEPQNRRVAEPANSKLYILSHLDCPAILVECGFMSNMFDLENLKKPVFQTDIAAVLMCSFLQYKTNALCI